MRKFAYYFLLISCLLAHWRGAKLCAANWNLEIKNVLYQKNNVRLSIFTTEKFDQEVSVSLQIKAQDYPAYVVQKKFTLKKDNETQFLSLPPDNYKVRVIIIENDTEVELEKQVKITNKTVENAYFSDIFLSHSPIINPIDVKGFRVEIPIKSQKNLYFLQSIQTQESNVTMRAILYQEVENQKILLKTNTYRSIAQLNKILTLKDKKGIVAGSFDIQNLDAGNYLIEVFIYAENTLIEEKSTNFNIIQEQYYVNPATFGQTIAQMKFVFSQEIIQKIEKQPTYPQKKQAFWEAWQTLYPNNGEKQADKYYEKLQKAQNLYTVETGNWDNDRIATYMRYGQPDEVRKFQTAKGDFEGWIYYKWELSFLFEKKGKEYNRKE